MNIKRGDIIIGNLSPKIGAELNKVRPLLVIQNDIGNQYSPLIIVSGITSNKFKNNFPTNVNISKKESGLEKDSVVLLNQIRTIDKSRVIKKIGNISNSNKILDINKAIMKSLGIE